MSPSLGMHTYINGANFDHLGITTLKLKTQQSAATVDFRSPNLYLQPVKPTEILTG